MHKLRFNGFDGEWEVVKLNQISSPMKKKNKDGTISNVFSNSAKFGIVIQEDFF